MDRNGQRAGKEPAPRELVLPSRRGALDAMREAMAADCRVILVTGEPGSGKSWLARQAAGSDVARSWLWVDVGPTTTPVDLMADLAHQLGCEDLPGPSARQWHYRVRERLEESALEGRSWGLVVDEVHLAGPDLLEQIRILTNESVLGRWLRPTLLCGQTPLLRRLRGPSLASLDARIELRVHLKPLDADEAIAWLAAVAGSVPAERAEAWHRDALGNPARLLRLSARGARVAPGTAPVRSPADRETNDAPGLGSSAEAPSVADAPLVPSTPPLQIDEGVIEVGWLSGEASGRSADTGGTERTLVLDNPSEGEPEPPAGPGTGTVELIHDRYAALQAWEEWSSGAADRSRPWPTGPGQDPDRTDFLDVDAEPADSAETRPAVWAEPADRFAPYSDLFRPRNPAPQADA